MGRFGYWAVEVRKLTESKEERYCSGSTPASAHRLRVELVRRAPRAILRLADFIESSNLKDDLVEWEYIGAR